MIDCDICGKSIDNDTDFVAVPNAQGLLTSAAHLGCSAQDAKYQGAEPRRMTVVRAGVIASHILKANGLHI